MLLSSPSRHFYHRDDPDLQYYHRHYRNLRLSYQLLWQISRVVPDHRHPHHPYHLIELHHWEINMTNKDSKDKKPDLPHPPTTPGQQNRRGGRQQHRNCWNNPGGGGHPPRILARHLASRTTSLITRARMMRLCSTTPSSK